jgi:hypothetical protein
MFCLITDLMDITEYPALELAGLYHWRWDGSETALRHEAHCYIARRAGRDERRYLWIQCLTGARKSKRENSMVRREALYRIPRLAGRNLVGYSWV